MSRVALSIRSAAVAAIAVAAVSATAPAAHARDFFSSFFGGFDNAPAPSVSLPYAPEFGEAPPPSPSKRVNIYGGRYSGRYSGGSTSFCVRTCDGRYFPVVASSGQTKAEACKSFCPASETKVYRGSTIDNASSDKGKSYSDLPNAFRYRNELIAGCTCNGKDPAGLASIKIEDDPTLRNGDIVAGEDGLMVARSSRRRAALNFTPAPKSIRDKFELPVVASKR